MDDADLGVLAQQGDRWTLTFTRRLPHPPERVWRAVTEPEHLAAWFPQRIVGERRPGTVLTLTDTFADLGKAARDAAGWHECLARLAASLAGTPLPGWGETWRQVHPRYVGRLGPEAATIGPPPGYAEHTGQPS